MCRWVRLALALGLALLAFAVLLPDTVAVWMDAEGHTYLTDREEAPAPGATRLEPADLSLGWGGQVLGEPLDDVTDSSDEDDRVTRELLTARDDIVRGEVRRGLAQLRRLHQRHPGRPDVAFLLAQVERRRGRLEPAREALEAALTVAAQLPDRWRDAAHALLREIDADLELADAPGASRGAMKVLNTPHFLVSYDHQFAGRAYGERVLAILEQVRAHLARSMGRTLARPLEIRLYTKTHYLDAYKDRFGFATVGFYDGAIHVVSVRRPRRELFALLIHEYAHALFEEALGGHQPFFLNEGVADREEEIARGRARLSRGEWRRLLDALRGGSWIPLESLVVGFGGLKGKRALLAYLESRAAVEMIEDHHPGAIARWLNRCADGMSWERALRVETGWGTWGLDHALRDSVRGRFPVDPLANLDTPRIPME
jgi:tetratricopeptide (TPR) repeat protein